MGKSSKNKTSASGPRVLENRKARFDYEFLETLEVGIALVGSEVKSVWNGRVNMTDAYCRIKEGELWLCQLDIEPYDHASHFQPERRRERKLLAHRKEIDTLERKTKEKGLTLLPYKIYFNDKGKVKVVIALGRGKKDYDKRESIAKKEQVREQQRLRSMKL